MKDNRLPAGHGWAYLGVILGLAASIAGNIASVVLTQSDVSLWLRVPLASLWTIFLGIGIEVLTRIEWERNWRHWGARAILVGPMSLVSGFMSYLHLHHLMVLSGEPGAAQAVGPLAVDGTLFGCTVALLVTRMATRKGEDRAARQTLAQRVAALRTTALDVKAAAAGQTEVPAPAEVPALEPAPATEVLDFQVPANVVPVASRHGGTNWVRVDPEPTAEVPAEDPAPVSPAPVRTRTSVDYAKVTALVLEHPKDQDVADLMGTSPKTPQRVRRAIRLMDTTQDLEAIASTVKLSLPAIQTIQKELSNR
jgi:hypothetical protein